MLLLANSGLIILIILYQFRLNVDRVIILLAILTSVTEHLADIYQLYSPSSTLPIFVCSALSCDEYFNLRTTAITICSIYRFLNLNFESWINTINDHVLPGYVNAAAVVFTPSF